MNRLQMRSCRGFICFLYSKIRLECALFVPYNSKNAFSGHRDRPQKRKTPGGIRPQRMQRTSIDRTDKAKP